MDRQSPDKLGEFPSLDEIPTLRELAKLELKLLPSIVDPLVSEECPDEREWLSKIRRLLTVANQRAKAETRRRKACAAMGRVAAVEYDFLFDKGNHLLAIGYNVTEHRRDSSYYDLLASEARL